MKKIILIAILLIFTFQNSIAQKFTEYYFKFEVQSKSDIEKITDIISIDNVKENTVYAYANEKELSKFKTLGYKIEYLKKQVPKSLTMATTVDQMANWDRYPTYEVYRRIMKNFELDYPSICKLDSIGTTVEGRKLYVLKISDNVNVNETEPEFFYTSTMHGDETTGYILMLRLTDSLLTSYGTETEITNLVNNIEIYINPNANPDGTYDDGNSTVSGSTRYNANGEDINRDFPDPRIGANTPYQPETQAMMDLAEARHFVMAANFHGGAEVVNYPWDTWTSSSNTHADKDWFLRVCTDYVTTARTILPNYMTDTYSSGVTEGGDWYVITGGRQDYMNYWHQCREITIELSSTKLLATENLNNFWKYNRESLLQFMKECTFGIHGTVKNINGNPIKAMIFVESHDQVADSSMVFSDSENGDYHRLLEPGSYSITASAYGYISKTINNIAFSSSSSVNVDFVLDSADVVSISGTITDGISTNSIENAKVSFLNAPVDPVYTDVSGNYTIGGIVEGEHTIQISKSGYSTLTDTIEIISESLNFNFALYPSVIENFETTDFSKVNWQFSGNSNWTINSAIKYEGLYSAKSGTIGNNSSTVLSVELELPHSGNISFYRKVSSESGYDYLKFYIDNQLKNSWSGEEDWEEMSYPVFEGIHTFKWEYSKDGAEVSGSDCAWIDYISFPYFSDTTLTLIPAELFDTLNNDEASVHEIFIYNNGSVINNYSVVLENITESENSWININKTSGTIELLSTDTLKVTMNNDSLAAGNYTCNIIFTEEDNDTYIVPVNLTVNEDTSIFVTPVSINDTLLNEEASVHNIYISNTGNVSNNYTVTIENESENSWLTIDKTSGIIEVSSKDTIQVTLSNDSLDTGYYSCNIIVTEEDNDTYFIPVNLHVPVIESIKNLKSDFYFSIFPNPFSSDFTIDFISNKSGFITIQILDINGKLIYQKEYTGLVSGNRYLFNENSKFLNQGIYIVKVITRDFTKSKKIIKN